jgi:Carboxypeptidase regulatory-like domain
MKRIDVRWWTLAVFAVLLLPLASPAFAQLQTGDLYGKVVDQQGQPLPGVTVTVTGVSSPQVQTTDQDGQFRFLGLYPGAYQLKAELEGFSTLEYPNITVRLGGKANLEVTLSSSVKDVITVTGEAPILDERQVNRGVDVSAVALDKVPTARDPWSLLSQAPGVLLDRINVGGNESGQQSNFLGVGSGSRDNTFAVDGVIVTDMNAVGGSASYFDFGAFEEVQLTVSSSDVTIATSGVTVNQITKRGTNEWRGQARFLRTAGSTQAKPVLIDGVEGNKIDNVDEYGADIGGPLWKDHLWLWGSYGRSDIRNVVQGGQLDETKLKDFNSKLNFQLGPQDSGVLHYWKNDKLKFGRGAGPTRAPETTWNQTTPADFYKVEDTFIPGSSFFVTGLYSHNPGKFTLTPLGGLDADIYRDDAGVLHGTYVDFAQTATINQARADANYFFDIGATHNELKFGGSYRDQENHSGSVWPRGKFVVSGAFNGYEGDLAQVVFPRNRAAAVDSRYDSAWMQDTLTVDRWTINAGLRYDRQHLKNLPVSDQGNPLAQGLLPPIAFQGNDAGGFQWNTVVPRLSATYALGENRKTLLRGSFSRYAEQLGQLPLSSRVNPIGYSYAYFYFNDVNHNLRLDPSEVSSLQFGYTYNIDPNNPSALISPNVNSKNLKPILTDEVALGFDHELRADLALSFTATYRNIHDIPELRTFVVDETGATRLATRPDWVVDHFVNQPLPNGQTSGPIPVYALRDGLTPTGGALFVNGDRKEDYKGATISLNKRLANRWSLRGNFTYADWTWKVGPQYRLYADPTNVVADPLGYADRSGDVYAEVGSGSQKADIFVGAKWSFSVNGLYQVAPDRPWGFNAGGSVEGREGYISPPYVRESGPLGRRNVQLTSDLEAFRNPSVVVVNGHLDKDVSFGDAKLNLAIDGFNLTNRSYVLQRERNARSTRAYGINETLSPRVFRFGATVRFR